MKKIFLAIAIFITVNNFCFSQEELVENKNLKPPSRVGGIMNIVAMLIPAETIIVGLGGEIFYHQTLTQKSFLSCGAIYIPKFEGRYLPYIPTENVTTFYFGLNYRNSISNRFSYYAGLEAHFMIGKRDVYSWEKHSATKKTQEQFFPFGIIGTSYPLSKNLNLDINTRILLILPTGINVGISYLLP